jgi:hypothetical protein
LGFIKLSASSPKFALGEIAQRVNVEEALAWPATKKILLSMSLLCHRQGQHNSHQWTIPKNFQLLPVVNSVIFTIFYTFEL